MGTAQFAVLGIVIVVFQSTGQESAGHNITLNSEAGNAEQNKASVLVPAEEPTCVPGFKSSRFIFKVSTKFLKPHTRLGKVAFTDCTDRTIFVFKSDDRHFTVQGDGILKVSTHVKELVHIRGNQDFFVHTWTSQGHNISVPVRVLHHSNHHGDHIHHNHQHHHHHHTKVDPANKTQSVADQPVPILHFRKASAGLRRRKRDWVIPVISVSENVRGPFPLKVSQIRSNEDKVKKIFYSITGPGADQDPVGLFVMDRDSGSLYLTQPLDREQIDVYKFLAHAVADGAGMGEEPMEINVKVIDQNDNKPVFSQDTYLGEVAEASAKGFEVIKVVATDADKPLTDNSDILYRIIDQEPKLPADNLFEINQNNGVIRVNAGGLDREKYPKYTLVVQAADMKGGGLEGETKVILTVTDSNDNAPVFTQPLYEASVAENKADTLVVTMSVTDGDEPHSPAWNAKFTIVDGDPGGLFTVKTGTNKLEGIISTVKGLDFETSGTHTLMVAVENEVPFATSLPTATATVVVTVEDVNEAPIFDPMEKHVT
ncbi:cadherin-1-like [Gymnodraco acuticeps]|uniref:Cadherin-1-like n=1 Tax=Gymnodraco acuticeps TaxID=8218 RepID=A0A6P8URN1_GYMAC|nr:cadherin-1-like [Gymnodraco acuticeps]